MRRKNSTKRQIECGEQLVALLNGGAIIERLDHQAVADLQANSLARRFGLSIDRARIVSALAFERWCA